MKSKSWMTFTPDRIRYVQDYTLSPMPGRDCHWFSVQVTEVKQGWAYSPASRPVPSRGWIADELEDLAVKMGRNVVIGRMLGGGMELANAPEGPAEPLWCAACREAVRMTDNYSAWFKNAEDEDGVERWTGEVRVYHTDCVPDELRDAA